MIDIQQQASNALTGFAPGAATDGASYFIAWASDKHQSGEFGSRGISLGSGHAV